MVADRDSTAPQTQQTHRGERTQHMIFKTLPRHTAEIPAHIKAEREADIKETARKNRELHIKHDIEAQAHNLARAYTRENAHKKPSRAYKPKPQNTNPAPTPATIYSTHEPKGNPYNRQTVGGTPAPRHHTEPREPAERTPNLEALNAPTDDLTSHQLDRLATEITAITLTIAEGEPATPADAPMIAQGQNLVWLKAITTAEIMNTEEGTAKAQHVKAERNRQQSRHTKALARAKTATAKAKRATAPKTKYKRRTAIQLPSTI